MYASHLAARGFLPIPASTVAHAAATARRADVIVAGILLLGAYDGVALIGRLRADDRTRSTPIIVLTACAWESERVRARAAGCDRFLAKPCLPDALVTELRRVLTVRKAPEDGDIVIRVERRADTFVHVLHTVPHAGRSECHGRDEGIAQAVALAKRQRVRAWLADEGGTFVLLEDCRAL